MDARMDEQSDGLTDKQMHDGHNDMTIPRWPLPSGAKNCGGKGEIAHYEQFLLFPQHFHKTSTADA